MHTNYRKDLKILPRHYTALPHHLQVVLYLTALSLPVVFYCLPFLLTLDKIAPGDADYLMQTTEAARITIIKYGQFPWFNPWISGGVPLFANPQFGLYSLPMVCGLLFGSIIGYKIALALYLLAAFWGIYILCRKVFDTPLLTSILLGYVWAFSGYFASRIAGHYTFFTIVFVPFILYFYLKRDVVRKSWLWLGLLIGMMINAAAHNTTIMGLAVFGLIVIFETAQRTVRIYQKNKAGSRLYTILIKDLQFFTLSALVALVISGQRLFHTLQYLKEYPRVLFASEETIGLGNGLLAIFGPFVQYNNQPHIPEWSWMEVSAYIGFFTAIAACISIFAIYHKPHLNVYYRLQPLTIILLGILFFCFGMGIFAQHLSPYYLLHHLPVFSGMRVATRWLVWTSLMAIVIIALYQKKWARKLINTCLAISAVELAITGAPQMASVYTIPAATYPQSQTVNQQIHYDSQRFGITYDENLTATTRSNIGQIVAGDALIDTRNMPPVGSNTIRCDSDTCDFVLTHNAKVTYWSPNYIQLDRTATGPIELNMNPGKDWLVNDIYPFSSMRLSEPDRKFIITDTSSKIDLRIQPKLSPSWFIWKLEKKE